jgi:uncharacterized repeat protein (TIGR02543 family)/uncharacterized repeat protein (TIGR01451 family)
MNAIADAAANTEGASLAAQTNKLLLDIAAGVTVRLKYTYTVQAADAGKDVTNTLRVVDITGNFASFDQSISSYASVLDSYTVTYDANFDFYWTEICSGTPPLPQTCSEGGSVTVKSDSDDFATMQMDMHMFSYWSTNPDGSGDVYSVGNEITNIQSDITLYAQWMFSVGPMASTYYLYYNGNGHDGGTAPATEEFQEFSGVVLASQGSLIKHDFVFAGWTDDTSQLGTPLYQPGEEIFFSGDTTLYAVWDKPYNITKTLNPGQTSFKVGDTIVWTIAVENIGGLPLYANAVLEESLTPGTWGISPDNTAYNIDLDPDVQRMELLHNLQIHTGMFGDLGLYSNWVILGDDVYIPIGGAAKLTYSYTVKASDAGNVITNTVAFTGFNEISPWDGIVISKEAVNSAASVDGITVTYNGNGKTSGTVPPPATHTSGNLIHTVAGGSGLYYDPGYGGYYEFDGWNTQSNGLGTSYSPGMQIPLTGDITLYVKWKEVKTKVIYYGNGATSGSVPVDSSSYSYKSYATVKDQGTLVKTGFVFLGWQRSDLGTIYQPGESLLMDYSRTFDTTMYAQWGYSVTYNGNGNTGGAVPAIGKYAPSATVTVAAKGTLVKNGSTFLGWSESAAAKAPTYQQGNTFSISSSKTLYAVWSAPFEWTGYARPINIDDPYAEIVFTEADLLYMASMGIDVFASATLTFEFTYDLDNNGIDAGDATSEIGTAAAAFPGTSTGDAGVWATVIVNAGGWNPINPPEEGDAVYIRVKGVNTLWSDPILTHFNFAPVFDTGPLVFSEGIDPDSLTLADFMTGVSVNDAEDGTLTADILRAYGIDTSGDGIVDDSELSAWVRSGGVFGIDSVSLGLKEGVFFVKYEATDTDGLTTEFNRCVIVESYSDNNGDGTVDPADPVDWNYTFDALTGGIVYAKSFKIGYGASTAGSSLNDMDSKAEIIRESGAKGWSMIDGTPLTILPAHVIEMSGYLKQIGKYKPLTFHVRTEEFVWTTPNVESMVRIPMSSRYGF